MVEVTTRFAPSPTGPLHLGHAWSALQAHDYARTRGGRFLLRIEDIDGTRSRPEHVDGIIEDLRWLGLEWGGDMLFQSTRLDAYQDALDRLNAMGLLYPCFCTRADVAREIEDSGSAPHDRVPRRSGGSQPGAINLGPIYNRKCRKLRPQDLYKQRIAGTPHVLRLKMDEATERCWPVSWTDEIQGRDTIYPYPHGDVVLARKDAPASYHLAVTVDDAAQGVTHVVRGQDLFWSTDVHRLLQALLDLPTPTYRHHPLLTDAEGNRLSKRAGSPTLAEMRAGGMDGRTLADDLRGGRLPIGFQLPKD